MTKKQAWMSLLEVGCAILAVVILALISSYFIRQSIEREFDEIDKNFAIAELYELRGRVKEIQYLNYSSAAHASEMEEKLFEHLRDISQFDSKNPYLEDFSITISTSYMGDICEEITSQIDKRLDTIKYGKGDA